MYSKSGFVGCELFGIFLAGLLLFTSFSGFAATQPVGIENALDLEKLSYPDQCRAVIEAIVRGPSKALREQGFRSLLPEGTDLVDAQIDDASITIRLSMDPEFLKNQINEVFVDEVGRIFAYPIRSLGRKFQMTILVRPSNKPDAPFKRINTYLPQAPPVNQKFEEAVVETESSNEEFPKHVEGQPPVGGQPQPVGPLTGKSIFISPGHGWYYGSGSWKTQRGISYGLIEDHSNGEACLNWLVKYLWNAGAGVYTCRERDMNTNMVIVDNGGSGYSESGSWSTQSTSGTYQGTQRVAAVSSSETATARFTPNIPQAGYYAVYVWYRTHTTGSSVTSTATKIRISHAGGTTTWTQNQTHDGYTWKYVGTYYFEQGSNSSMGSVVVSNQGTESGKYVVADAVRFGGGRGDYNDGGGVSNKPRWEESGKYYSVFMGNDYWDSTVSTMPRYSAWESESWEDSVYISWHTNASSGTVRGTSSFVYSSEGWGGPFEGYPGSQELQDAVHAEIVNDIRRGWDASWRDFGQVNYWLGEVNPSNNNEMPAVLVEMAFHDEPNDAAAIIDPRFRQICARAYCQGIVKYFAQRDGIPVRLAPEPPTHLSATLNNSGEIELSWNAPPSNTGNNYYGDPATGYKVYMSTHPYGFADGVIRTSTNYTVSSGLTPGEVYYFRVSATNLGGESFPTETLAIRYQSAGRNPLLIVSGFDRLDRFMLVKEGSVNREYLNLMNTYNYTVFAAQDIEGYDQYFDSCSNEAVESGFVSLSDYRGVIWLLGEESIDDKTLSSTEQAVLSNYLDQGGALFISGAEIGWELVSQGGGSSFFSNYLKSSYVSDDAATYTVSAGSGIFSGLGSFTFDSGSSVYNVDYADRLTPQGGAVTTMTYVGGSGGTAAIEYDGDYKLVYLAFPYETILGSNRQEVMNRVLDFFQADRESGFWQIY